MKLDINNQHHAETLARYLSGEMDKDEQAVFEKQVTETEENSKEIQDMKKQWKAISHLRETKNPDTGNAWNKLHTRFINENLIPIQVVALKKQIIPVLLRYAAIAIILVGVASIIYYLSRDSKPTVEMVQVNTGNESNTLIKTLTDGSVIYLAQNSVFSFPKSFESTSRNVELTGEAFFDIASNPARPFIIETGEAIIEVLGTAFNVKTNNGTNFELIVDRGKVKVTMKKNLAKSESVVAGESITAINNSLIKSKTNGSDMHAWYKKRMQFKDESLRNILSVLNRNFNTNFVTANQEIGNRKLTVTFSNETSETMTELICQALNLKSQTIDDSIILSDSEAGTKRN